MSTPPAGPPAGGAGGPAGGPDETDLRLVAALADLSRATAADLAAYAGVPLVEAVARLARLQGTGLPMVLGVEGDQRRLRAWVAQRRAARPPQQAARQQPQAFQQPQPTQQPQASRPVPAPQQATPPPSGARAAPVDPWGPPQPAAWATTGAATGADAARAATHRRPGLGDRVDADGPTGPVALTLVDVVDTADALYAAAGHALPPGARAAVVHTEVTTGRGGFPAVPDTLLTLVLDDGSEVGKSGATLSSRPPFQGPLAPDDTVGGHTLYELDAGADIVAVRWRALPGARPVEWRVTP